MKYEIITDHKPRAIVYGYELTKKQRANFDWIPCDEIDLHEFIKYKRAIYSLSEFMKSPFPFFDGFAADTYFSGVGIRFVDSDSVIVGRVYS